MSRTFTNLLTHLVFSTKNRERLIVPDFKAELHAYLGGLTRELKGKAYSIGGYDDHVYMLVNLPPVISISDALRFIKSNSSGWIHDKWPQKPFGNRGTGHSVLASRTSHKFASTSQTRKTIIGAFLSNRSLLSFSECMNCLSMILTSGIDTSPAFAGSFSQ